ncbi:MAG TPA: hypothetical protein PKY59_18190 [Pyrinomonadaceae bacterium]|nr:hypothetical protein [Pyrinomonadaceae bacterium]
MFRKFIFLAVLTIFGSFSVSAQTADLQTILTEAQKQTDFYRETFRNLLAEETKTFEEFDKNGISDKRSVVKSNFLVYQSGKDATKTAELRNVIEVDGKTIPNSQKRSDELFAELEKSETYESELKKIVKESLRFDKTWEINGVTLNEGFVLHPNFRSSFDFKLVGSENLPEGSFYVVNYRQNKSNPNIIINGKPSKTNDLTLQVQINVPSSLKKEELILSGKLWIDAKTFQILREERNIVPKSNDLLILHTTNLEYAPSEYGILVPKTIALTFFDAKKQNNNLSMIKDTVVNFDYSKFRKTETDIIILDN